MIIHLQDSQINKIVVEKKPLKEYLPAAFQINNLMIIG
jgi:hypothetical protein